MKKILINLATIFVIEAQRKRGIRETARFSQVPSNSAWTDEQLYAIAEIKAMYEKDCLHMGRDDESSDSDIAVWRATNNKLQKLCNHYIALQQKGERDLEAIDADAEYREWVATQPYEPGQEEMECFLEPEDVHEHMHLTSEKIQRLQKFCRTLGINYGEFTHPDRDKALHRMFDMS